MNTRDKIAIAAMNGLMTKKTWDLQEFKQDPMRIAMWSYDIADAMIIEKKRRELVELDEVTEPPNPYLDKPISALFFTTRTNNCLKAENIYYVKDLIKWSAIQLLRTPNLGKHSLKEIKEELARIGLSLREDK